MVEYVRHIAKLTLDQQDLLPRSRAMASEVEAAINDLLEENEFVVVKLDKAPEEFFVHVAVVDNRLRLDIYDIKSQEEVLQEVLLPLGSFRSLIKDYTTVCSQYEDAVKAANPGRIEALDVARRSIHNEGAGDLQSLLEEQIRIDFATARRFFTLIWVLHQK